MATSVAARAMLRWPSPSTRAFHCRHRGPQHHEHYVPTHMRRPLLCLGRRLLSSTISPTPTPPPTPLPAAVPPPVLPVSTASGYLPVNPALSPPSLPSSPSSTSSASSPPSSSPALPGSRPPPPPPRPPTFLRNTIFVSLCALYLYLHYASSRAAIACSPTVSSPSTDEVHDLLSRTRLTSDDLIRLYSTVMRRYPVGLVPLEGYARMLEGEVTRLKGERRKSRHQRKAQQQLSDQRRLEEHRAAEAEVERRRAEGEEVEPVPPFAPASALDDTCAGRRLVLLGRGRGARGEGAGRADDGRRCAA